MANFIPPANGASLGSYFSVYLVKMLLFWPSALAQSATYWELGSKFVTDRQTERQTNSLTPFTGVWEFFLSVKFATSLLAWLAGG